MSFIKKLLCIIQLQSIWSLMVCLDQIWSLKCSARTRWTGRGLGEGCGGEGKKWVMGDGDGEKGVGSGEKKGIFGFFFLVEKCKIPHCPRCGSYKHYMYISSLTSTRHFGSSLASDSVGTPKLSEFTREQSHDG